VWRHIDSILFAGAKLKVARIPADLSEDQRRRRREENQVAAGGIVPATESLEQAFFEVMPFVPDDAIEVLADYVGFVRGVMASERTWREKGDLLSACTPMIIDVLGGGPWKGRLDWVRWRYRTRRLQQFKTFVAAATPPPPQ